ncbi:MAG: histidine kinase N-terminal 7TM domain-containing protein [Bacteroidota bacterium]|nr:histidine kinase N-terminal 7TM domain-containing protein [Bacteroidota bacterium]
MLDKYSILYYLLVISTLSLVVLEALIIKMRNKRQIHYAFVSIIFFMCIYNLSIVIQLPIIKTRGYLNILTDMYFIGAAFVAVSVLYAGIIFAKTKISFSIKHLLVFIVPIITVMMIITNDYHHLFEVEFRLDSGGDGPYFYVHAIYSYICIAIGLFYFIAFSIKNSGFFSKQSMLIFIGILVPTLFDTLGTFDLIDWPAWTENITFAFLPICFMFAILKFDFLNVVPIALQRVVDLISDSYIVLNENLEIIDYNKTLINTFNKIIKIQRKNNFVKTLKENENFSSSAEDFGNLINTAVSHKKPISFEKQIASEGFDKYFSIEITPIYSGESFMGTIVLFKDITQHKKDMELIQQTQKQLTERERLASLGELAGGVAHDINSPMSAVHGGLEFIQKLFEQYVKLSKEENPNKEKLKEIEDEILHQISNGNSASDKIIKIVNSIRNHTRNISGDTIQDFKVDGVIEDIKVILHHQLKQAVCEIIQEGDKEITLKGDPGKLEQVLTNLVVNSIQAYNGMPGKIFINTLVVNGKAIISVHDNAGGIPENFKEHIFKKMLTTKGTEGTGMGLYLSHSIITGHFGGKMTFESEEGKGTTFNIEIPQSKDNKKEE